MKKQILVLLAMMGLTVSGLAQGQVALLNDSSSRVYILTPTNLATAGSVLLQLYAAAGTNAFPLEPIGPVVGILPNLSGLIEPTVIDVPFAPNGEAATFQIWVWSSLFETRDAAVTAGDLVGCSDIFISNTSFQEPGFPPPLPVSLAGKFPAFGIVPIPEPSTKILGTLGLGFLLILRRQTKLHGWKA